MEPGSHHHSPKVPGDPGYSAFTPVWPGTRFTPESSLTSQQTIGEVTDVQMVGVWLPARASPPLSIIWTRKDFTIWPAFAGIQNRSLPLNEITSPKCQV